jgi:hypothetical protein
LSNDIPNKLKKPLACNKCDLSGLNDIAALRTHQLEAHEKQPINMETKSLKRNTNAQKEVQAGGSKKKQKVSNETYTDENEKTHILDMLKSLNEDELVEYNFAKIDESALFERSKALFSTNSQASNKCK